MSCHESTPPDAHGTPDFCQHEVDDQPDAMNQAMTAAATVLGLPELLEKILLHLDDWKQPFALLRVNNTFKQTIDSSLALRQKMWLVPTPAFVMDTPHPPLEAFDDADDDADDDNEDICGLRELSETFNPLLLVLTRCRTSCRWAGVDGQYISIMGVSPSITKDDIGLRGHRQNESMRAEIAVVLLRYDTGYYSTADTTIFQGTSWRNTLLSQLAFSLQANIVVAYCLSNKPGQTFHEIMEPGTTLGKFKDALVEACHKASATECLDIADCCDEFKNGSEEY